MKKALYIMLVAALVGVVMAPEGFAAKRVAHQPSHKRGVTRDGRVHKGSAQKGKCPRSAKYKHAGHPNDDNVQSFFCEVKLGAVTEGIPNIIRTIQHDFNEKYQVCLNQMKVYCQVPTEYKKGKVSEDQRLQDQANWQALQKGKSGVIPFPGVGESCSSGKSRYNMKLIFHSPGALPYELQPYRAALNEGGKLAGDPRFSDIKKKLKYLMDYKKSSECTNLQNQSNRWLKEARKLEKAS